MSYSYLFLTLKMVLVLNPIDLRFRVKVLNPIAVFGRTFCENFVSPNLTVSPHGVGGKAIIVRIRIIGNT